jgi:hypothetical protein
MFHLATSSTMTASAVDAVRLVPQGMPGSKGTIIHTTKTETTNTVRTAQKKEKKETTNTARSTTSDTLTATKLTSRKDKNNTTVNTTTNDAVRPVPRSATGSKGTITVTNDAKGTILTNAVSQYRDTRLAHATPAGTKKMTMKDRIKKANQRWKEHTAPAAECDRQSNEIVIGDQPNVPALPSTATTKAKDMKQMLTATRIHQQHQHRLNNQ